MRALLLFLLVACQREHTVKILLGPGGAPTEGLTCRAPPRMVDVVVDVISIGGRVLGCRGEELLRSCASDCVIAQRECAVVDLRDGVASALEQLADFAIDNVPDDPVVIRVSLFPHLGTTPECAAYPIDAPLPTANMNTIGCAYTCPAQLDLVDEVTLSLDALGTNCGLAVDACAGFQP